LRYTVAVRELCEFTAKEGDLDLRFTPAPTAMEGIAGHALVASRRGPGYEVEPSLCGDHGRLHVRGRADGFDPARQRLDEVKTHKGRLDRHAKSHRRLHWAQARIYGWLLCQQRNLAGLDIALIYLDVRDGQETVFTVHSTATELRLHFEERCERFLAWAERQLAHRAARDDALRSLAFPFGDFRVGQRPLAEAVYKAALAGRCLLAQAPTGTGKSMGTLFALLKAVPTRQLDRLYFLAAKTSGRQPALDALQHIGARAPGLPLRALELVARDKACEHPGKACHGECCPLARGFYDRLPAARDAALSPSSGLVVLDQARLRELALRHAVCPYYLSQELARWVDVVVGDYNHYFDHGALLRGLALANQWRIGLLVDEAHNLVGRGRAMATAELQPDHLVRARRSAAAAASAAVRRALDKVGRCWTALDKAQAAPYHVHASFPGKLLSALQQCTGAIADHLAEVPLQADAALLQFHFGALKLVRLAELLDAHSLVDVSKPSASGAGGARPGRSTVCIRNLVPAPFLKPGLEAAHTSALFSATLQPTHFYADLLGLPADTVCVDVVSPFKAEQLQVRIASHISTRYRHRAASLSPIVELMARQFEERPGNYLAFFSSYEYLQQVAELFARRHPGLPTWSQSRRMREAEQRQFLQRFTDHGQGIGFAVLGGVFAEGIDLPGRRLIGAFLSTLGLPQVNPVNEQIRQRMQSMFGAGDDYAYLYPGLQKVVQAAGRVIRTPADRGVIHLMDDRFDREEVRALLPRWWQPAPADRRPAWP
jgi:DNA excision repair protein ERCC-2